MIKGDDGMEILTVFWYREKYRQIHWISLDRDGYKTEKKNPQGLDVLGGLDWI